VWREPRKVRDRAATDSLTTEARRLVRRAGGERAPKHAGGGGADRI